MLEVNCKNKWLKRLFEKAAPEPRVEFLLGEETTEPPRLLRYFVDLNLLSKVWEARRHSQARQAQVREEVCDGMLISDGQYSEEPREE